MKNSPVRPDVVVCCCRCCYAGVLLMEDYC